MKEEKWAAAQIPGLKRSSEATQIQKQERKRWRMQRKRGGKAEETQGTNVEKRRMKKADPWLICRSLYDQLAALREEVTSTTWGVRQPSTAAGFPHTARPRTGRLRTCPASEPPPRCLHPGGPSGGFSLGNVPEFLSGQRGGGLECLPAGPIKSKRINSTSASPSVNFSSLFLYRMSNLPNEPISRGGGNSGRRRGDSFLLQEGEG